MRATLGSARATQRAAAITTQRMASPRARACFDLIFNALDIPSPRLPYDTGVEKLGLESPRRTPMEKIACVLWKPASGR